MKSHFVKAVVFAILVFTAALLSACSDAKIKSATYEFTSIRRTTLERTVSSSGTLSPVSTVSVLPRMSGRVEKIYVDYNDPVSEGDILAELNTDVLKLKREQQYAAVIKARANYELQTLNYRGQEILAQKNLISEYELKTNKTELDGQAADLSVAETNMRVIETEINQYAYITSPINGIVLDRRINVGDTVAESSSSSTSMIFLLAENLKEMQIEAGVGELDAAGIYKGQPVRFTLESLPGRRFTGEVETLRMVPVVSNNVTSYTVVIKVDNQDGSLLPGMTCSIHFVVERSENALAVSNAALRYQPTTLSADKIEEMVFYAGLANMNDEERKAAIEGREQALAQAAARNANSGGIASLFAGGGQANRQNSRPPPGQGRRAQVVMRNIWYIGDDGKLAVMRVQTGVSNGSLTEIFVSEDLEGRQVILREKVL